MEFLGYIGLAIVLSIIYIAIIQLHRDRNIDLQIRIESLKSDYSDYEEKFEEKYKNLIKENSELQKYKTLYELKQARRKGKSKS